MTNILNTLSAQADSPAGTYVGANISPFTDKHRVLLKAINGIGGSKVVSDKLHTTVIYSKGAYVDPSVLEPAVNLYKTPLRAKIIGAAAFDALPRQDGSRDEEVSTLVLKLEAPELMELHTTCKQLGCTHSYPELAPHVSLYYGVPKAECHAAVDALNALIPTLPEPLYVELSKLYVEPIKLDWAVKSTKG